MHILPRGASMLTQLNLAMAAPPAKRSRVDAGPPSTEERAFAVAVRRARACLRRSPLYVHTEKLKRAVVQQFLIAGGRLTSKELLKYLKMQGLVRAASLLCVWRRAHCRGMPPQFKAFSTPLIMSAINSVCFNTTVNGITMLELLPEFRTGMR